MTRVKRIMSGVNAAVLALSTLMTFAITGVAHATVQTCVWTGASSNSFNTAGNWTSCNSSVPQAGDFIKFSTATSTDKNLTNNLSVALGGVIAGQVSVTGSNGAYIIDTLSLADGATLTQDPSSDCGITHAQSVRITAVSSTGSISDSANMTNTATLTIGGNYTSTRSDIVAGNGSVVTGGITIAAAPAGVCGTGGGGSNGGSSITGIATIHSLTLQNGTSISLGDVTYPLTLGGGSGADKPKVYFFKYDDSFQPAAVTYTISGAITLLGDASFNVGDLTTVNVTGAITGAGFAITRDPVSYSTGVLSMQPSSNGSSTVTGDLVNPVVTTTFSDSQPTKPETVVDQETAVLDGEREDVEVLGGGTLKGTGTTHYLYVDNKGVVAPGHSPGTLTVTAHFDLSDGATYQAEIKNATAGNFDQIVVGTASDTTGNDVVLGSTNGATLDTELYSGAKIKSGDTFEIINNLSATPVLKTFAGLPEGTTFKVGNGTMKISYVGGDGNDVVLTAMTAITAPDTGFAFVSAHPGATLVVTAAAAATILVIARKNGRKLAPARAKASRR